VWFAGCDCGLNDQTLVLQSLSIFRQFEKLCWPLRFRDVTLVTCASDLLRRCIRTAHLLRKLTCRHLKSGTI